MEPRAVPDNLLRSNGQSPTIGYVYSRQLIEQCDRVPNLLGRASMVHSLIESYGLLKNVTLIESQEADEDVMTGFHSQDYLNCIKENSDEDGDEEFGLGYDCPPLEDLFTFCRVIAGGSVSAAKALVENKVDIALNFCGGWHHAQRDQASGFCYINDIVLAILELQKKFKRVLYIDVDIHHGDGVENAFAYSQKVLTLSLHKCEEGYFPGTGFVDQVGLGKGRYYACNVPLRDGASDAAFVATFEKVCERAVERFRPEAIVFQCGADGLASDPLGTFNLTLESYLKSVRLVSSLRLPLLVLGGGGYAAANAARCFAGVTAALLQRRLPQEIPEHDYFHCYGPAFDLEVTASNRRDENTPEYLRNLLREVLENLDHVE